MLNNGWSKVIYNNTAAYCDSEYLTTTKPAEAVNHDETPAGEVARSEVDTTYYTSVALKLHVTYAQDSSVVAVVPMGTALHVQYLLDNHWAQVEYGGQTAYCVSQFLVTEQPAGTQNAPVETAFTEVDDQVYPIAALHIRETPSLGGKVLSTPDANTEWHRVAYTADGWSIVLYNGETVYCATEYVTQ